MELRKRYGADYQVSAAGSVVYRVAVTGGAGRSRLKSLTLTRFSITTSGTAVCNLI